MKKRKGLLQMGILAHGIQQKGKRSAASCFTGWSMRNMGIRLLPLSSARKGNWWQRIWSMGLMRGQWKLLASIFRKRGCRWSRNRHLLHNTTSCRMPKAAKQNGNINIFRIWMRRSLPTIRSRTIWISALAWKARNSRLPGCP